MPRPSRLLHACAISLAALALCAGTSRAASGSMDREVIEELNFARTRPADYARELADYRARFTGRVAHEREGDLGVGTFEGPGAVDQSVGFVGRLRRVAPVAFDPALARAAADHADDQARTGGVGHVGSDSSHLGQRVWRYAKGRGLVAEIISYGQPTAQRAIRQLVIDDGEPGRPHRADVFDPALTRAGAACRTHPRYQYVCVIDLSGEPLADR